MSQIGHVNTCLLQIIMFRKEYHLKVVNKSRQSWTFCVYQKVPDIVSENVFSLTWLASPYRIGVNSFQNFFWNPDYEFVWYDSGTLEPGVRFLAGGSQKCNPNTENHTEFTVSEGGEPDLSKPNLVRDQKGTLSIHTGEHIPFDKFAVGIGMSGNGTFVQQAQPNLTYTFPTPPQSYWVGASNHIKVETVLDIHNIATTAEVKFPYKTYSLVATLDEDNKWDFATADMTGDTDTIAGSSTRTTTTTNIRTTTTYCCALI